MRQGLKRSLWPALVASFALHGAFAGLWVLWPADGRQLRADGRADPGIIEIVLASLPDAAPPPSQAPSDAWPAAGPEDAAEDSPSVPSVDAPASAVASPAPAPTRPKAAERTAMPTPPMPPPRRVEPPAHDLGQILGQILAVEPAAGSGIPAAAPADPVPLAAGAAEAGAAASGPGGGLALGMATGGGPAMAPGYALGSSSNPRPTYPLAARYDGIEGRVMLRVRVDADGLVSGIDIATTSGHPILDRAALETVRRWRFEPARSGGMTVPGEVDVPIQFRLRG